jgi:hypothetical protein
MAEETSTDATVATSKAGLALLDIERLRFRRFFAPESFSALSFFLFSFGFDSELAGAAELAS